MPIQARYVHTNIVAKDWKRLARFYETGTVQFVYVTDPEGNIIELQQWSK